MDKWRILPPAKVMAWYFAAIYFLHLILAHPAGYMLDNLRQWVELFQ